MPISPSGRPYGPSRARAVAAGRAGHLRIGGAESATAPVPVPVLARWLPAHPNVRISLSEHASADRLSRELADGGLDVTMSPGFDDSGANQVSLGDEEILAATSSQHRLAGRSRDPSLREIA